MKSQFLLSFKEYMQHPIKLGTTDIERFLTHLAVEHRVAVKTQALALNAILFMYRDYLQVKVEPDMRFQKSLKHAKLPLVLTKTEMRHFVDHIDPRYKLQSMLLYGSGLRLMECIRLRIQDIDFDYGAIRVWQGKGGKNRTVTLAKELHPLIREQISLTHRYYQKDMQTKGYGGVYIPQSRTAKYPNAQYEFRWHFLFPSHRLSKDAESELLKRHHMAETVIQRSVKRTAKEAGIEKNVTCHTKGNHIDCYVTTTNGK